MPHHQLCIQYAVSDGADVRGFRRLRRAAPRPGRSGASRGVAQDAHDALGLGADPAGARRRGLDVSHALGCVAPRSVQSAGRSITLPAARRSDAAPYGFAVDEIGLLRPVAVSVAGDVATLSEFAAAVSYQVLYYPLLTVRAPQGARVEYDAAGAAASWEIVFEE